MKELVFIDLFAGAGGVTTGIEEATVSGRKCAHVLAAVNHDAKAIESHRKNHPLTHHFVEDIRTIAMYKLTDLVDAYRKINPDMMLCLWASLECTNFSKAKGGKPREADSRTLADHMDRYVEALRPEKIFIENVREFMSWGPLDEKGKPISKENGIDYQKWVNRIKSYGYDYSYRLLNSADYGARTSRIRFFAQFVRKGSGLSIDWPEPTHAKGGRTGMFGNLKPWRPVRDVLDLTDEGNSIFTREKPLVEKTLERIYAGLIKFVANGDTSFIAKYFSGRPEGKVISLSGPLGAIKTIDGQSLVSAMMMQYYGNGQCSSIDQPANTISTKDRFAIVKPTWIDTQYSHSTPSSIDEPTGAILGNPKQALVSTVKCQYLMNPQYSNAGASIEKPCFTLIARMDKAPPYLVSTEAGATAILVYDTDSPMTVKIKQFMAVYGIADIKMRMLRVNELKIITGFPADYFLAGSQADQKKMIGNAVPTMMGKVLAEATYIATKEMKVA